MAFNYFSSSLSYLYLLLAICVSHNLEWLVRAIEINLNAIFFHMQLHSTCYLNIDIEVYVYVFKALCSFESLKLTKEYRSTLVPKFNEFVANLSKNLLN